MFDRLAHGDLPWECPDDGRAFRSADGSVSGVASDPAAADRIVRCVNAHDRLLTALRIIQAAADHRARFGCYPAGLGVRGMSFEAWLCSVVDEVMPAAVSHEALAPLLAMPSPGDRPVEHRESAPMDLPKAA